MTCYAWTTYADSEVYMTAALVLYHSLLETQTKHKFVLVIPCTVKDPRLALFPDIVIKHVEPLDRSCTQFAHQRYSSCLNKLYCWALTDYDKVCWLDSDMIVMSNIDDVFDVDVGTGIAAARGCLCNVFKNPKLITAPECCPFNNPDGTYVNAGLLLLKPCLQTFRQLQEADYDHPFAEQDTFNEVFEGNKIILDSTYNYLNHMPFIHPNVATCPRVYHFGYGKPWENNLLNIGHTYYIEWNKLSKKLDDKCRHAKVPST